MAFIRHIYLNKLTCCLFAMLLPVAAFAQDHQNRLQLALNLTGSGFSHIQDASPAFSPEMRARWEFSEASAIEGAFSIAEFSQNFDTPNGVSSLRLHAWWAEIGLSQQIFTIGESIKFCASLGGGITSVHRPEGSISLGALGMAALPASTDSRAHILSGIRLAREFFDSITVNVGTNIRLLSPFSEPETGYSVFGGLSVEIL